MAVIMPMMMFSPPWFSLRFSPVALPAAIDPRSLAAPAQQAAQQAGQQTWDKVPPSAKAILQQQVTQGRQSLDQAKAFLADQAAQRSEQGLQGLQGIKGLGGFKRLQGWVDQASNAASSLLGRAEMLLGDSVQQWLVDHQVMVWVAKHPVWATLGLVLLTVLMTHLITRLLFTILNPRNWVRVLSLPLRLAQVGIGTEPLSFEQRLQPGEIRQSEVDALMRRLEALTKEQEILHGQLKALLGEQEPKP